MATLWPQATTGVSSSTFGSGHLLHDLEKLASGTVLKSNKYFLSELWRLATAIAENKQQTRQYASDEDLARVGKLPDNYPFCSQQEAVDWIKDNGGGHRTLCSAVTWLIQNLVLQTQTKIGERQFEKDFMRLDGSLRQLRFFETTPQLHLDPALGNESETRSCSSHQQLRVCRSKWLLMSVMMQLAPEKHRDQIHGFLSKSMPVIPEKVNLNWHVIIELINMDKLLRISFITVCYRNLDYLAHGEHPLPFTFEAAALQKMLKLAVEEVSSEDFHYQQGLDVSTRDQTIRHKASLVPAQGANANHLSAALQAKDQANFFTKRKASAREVIKLLLLKMGQFVRKWLGDCEIKIKKNKNVPSANGHLVLFGAEVPPKFLYVPLSPLPVPHPPPLIAILGVCVCACLYVLCVLTLLTGWAAAHMAEFESKRMSR